MAHTRPCSQSSGVRSNGLVLPRFKGGCSRGRFPSCLDRTAVPAMDCPGSEQGYALAYVRSSYDAGPPQLSFAQRALERDVAEAPLGRYHRKWHGKTFWPKLKEYLLLDGDGANLDSFFPTPCLLISKRGSITGNSDSPTCTYTSEQLSLAHFVSTSFASIESFLRSIVSLPDSFSS
jgi:hypothetical protein